MCNSYLGLVHIVGGAHVVGVEHAFLGGDLRRLPPGDVVDGVG